MKCKHVGLVLSGGGLNGFSYIGVITYLNDIQCLRDIHTFVGTSAGGILCMLLALDVDLQNIVDMCNNSKFLQCFSNMNLDIEHMLESYGIIDTLELKSIIELLFLNKYGKTSLTMKDAYQLTGKQCTLVSTNVHTMDPIYMNHETHPDTTCIDAILATCAIPFLFPAIHLQSQNNNVLAIDGAFIDNFAYSYAMNHYNLKPYNTISICLCINKPINEYIDNTCILSYTNRILYLVSTCIVYHQYILHKNNPDIYILSLNHTLPISKIMNMNMNHDILDDMIHDGYHLYSEHVQTLPNSIVTEYYLKSRYECN